MSTGDSVTGAAGSISVPVGSGHTGNGADIILQAGGITLATPNAGRAGSSGTIALKTGICTSGVSDSVAIETDNSVDGPVGRIALSAGSAEGNQSGGSLELVSGGSVDPTSGAGNIASSPPDRFGVCGALTFSS